jgi:hypothetical protein
MKTLKAWSFRAWLFRSGTFSGLWINTKLFHVAASQIYQSGAVERQFFHAGAVAGGMYRTRAIVGQSNG